MRSEDSVVVPGRSALTSFRLEAEELDDDDSSGDADDFTGAFCSALGVAIGKVMFGFPQGSWSYSCTYYHIHRDYGC